MPVAEESVRVTIDLPRHLFERATDSAARAHMSVEEQIAGLVESGLSQLSVDRALNDAYDAYLNHMSAEGRKPQTATQLWDQMRRTRKEDTSEPLS